MQLPCYDVMLCFCNLGSFWLVASLPEDVLGGGGRLLYAGVNRHLHVPIPKRVRTFPTDHGHVRGWVSRSVWHTDFEFEFDFVSSISLRDLGLERFDTVELFARILLPAAFLLACILQLHYFNSDFLTLSDIDNVPVRQVPRCVRVVFFFFIILGAP